MRHLLTFGTTIGAVAALSAAFAVAPASSGSGHATSRLATTCLRTADRVSACQLVVDYFGALNAGRFEDACSLLGPALRRETGGADCASVLAPTKGTPFEVIAARRSHPGVIVLARVG